MKSGQHNILQWTKVEHCLYVEYWISISILITGASIFVGYKYVGSQPNTLGSCSPLTAFRTNFYVLSVDAAFRIYPIESGTSHCGTLPVIRANHTLCSTSALMLSLNQTVRGCHGWPRNIWLPGYAISCPKATSSVTTASTCFSSFNFSQRQSWLSTHIVELTLHSHLESDQNHYSANWSLTSFAPWWGSFQFLIAGRKLGYNGCTPTLLRAKVSWFGIPFCCAVNVSSIAVLYWLAFSIS